MSHLSRVGCESPMTVGFAVTAVLVGAKPRAWPATKLCAPVVEEPKVVSYELSLMAKCWA